MTFFIGLVCFIVGGCVGVLVMAVLNVVRIGNDTADLQELADLRKRLAACQLTAQAQQERADTYYALFCEGARANTALRHGR